MRARTALVLGGGGTVGMSYHAGILRALDVVGGFRPDDADLVVGTSAGSVVGAYLRSGWTTEDFWQLSLGTHPSLAGLSHEEIDAQRSEMFTPVFRSGPELVRRMMGSAFVLGRSVVRMPVPVAPRWLSQLFPGGLFDMTEGKRRFADEIPDAWPDKPLWLCAVDITSGRRIVLGRPGAPAATLAQGVTASCAIPGFYQPVKVGGRTLVDGGAHSTTNLDLAAKGNYDLIIGVAPMAFDPLSAPNPIEQLVRRVASRQLAGELAVARQRGAQVLLFRPTAAELRLHGLNLMRSGGWDEITKAAYEAGARTLELPRFRRLLGEAAA
ncbi:MAG: patatin-like phospholipase family protein [Acidimicrobiales bacterium]